jgi:hypothetical protein
MDTQGVSWDNILKGIDEAALKTGKWDEYIKQVIADQQVVQ